jgi:hypothetical protein
VTLVAFSAVPSTSLLRPSPARLIGPLGSSTFSLPAVERSLSEMEDGGSRRAGGAPTPHEVLQNFFKSLLNTKYRGVSLGSALAVNPGVALGKAGTSAGPRTLGGCGGMQGGADSGTEGG